MIWSKLCLKSDNIQIHIVINMELQETPKKRKPGRPTKYRPEMIPKVREFARAGMTRADIAVHLGVHISKLCEYANKYREFREALDHESEIANTAVASALYLKATGQATKTTKKIVTRPDGAQEIHETVETLGADAQAARYWLNNRAPKHWRDRVEVTGANGEALAVNLSWLQGARQGRGSGEVIDVTEKVQNPEPKPLEQAMARVSGPKPSESESDA